MSTETLIEIREEVARMGEQIYEHLRSALEADHNGQLVAIHIPSQEYFLGDSLLEAACHLREKYPRAGRGEVYTRGIGQPVVIRAHASRLRGRRVNGRLLRAGRERVLTAFLFVPVKLLLVHKLDRRAHS